ncbi:MAG: cytochrome c oxidase subunit [Chloroflexota bacterium]|nr:cytochrome c oxidase subunit [Chloroflexota bacterium]
MATIAVPSPIAERRVLRPIAPTGVWSWITTIDHKRIGVLYGTTAFIFFLIGGLEALLMRTQLIRPNNTLLGPDQFNGLFTMHGTTMIFLVVMPLSAAFFNYVVPLQIGARDVAFPRLNAFSYWTFLSGAILLNLGFVAQTVPDNGWFSYANITERAFSPSAGQDFWVVGLQVLGVASLAAALNFLVTIVQLRAPGMSLMRMPLFTWTTFITSILIVLAFPVIAIALFELMFDRLFGTNFFNTIGGGDPILWQHLFWTFGHPEVYILILPAMGIVSEILPVFSRKPLFGYPFMVYAVAGIAFLSFTVWAHHMFTTGLGAIATSFFAASTMLIAVPTGVKIFNWISTIHGGSLKLTTPALMSIGFVSMFTIGGLSGVMHASPPIDTQHQDTYFVVAHFHYVLFGGAIFGLFGGIYYWWPKITGRLLDDGIGKLQFWLMMIGFNLTFGPMHFLGIDGMPRRIYTYPANMGWDMWNLVASIGAYTLGLAILVMIFNIAKTFINGERAGADPWDGMTLEWTIPSPPPAYNFAVIPEVHSRDPFWLQKHPELASHELTESTGEITIGAQHVGDLGIPAVHAGQDGGHEAHGDVHVHMPDPSYWPPIAGLGFFIAGLGVLIASATTYAALGLTGIGLLTVLVAIYGWSLEPVNG